MTLTAGLFASPVGAHSRAPGHDTGDSDEETSGHGAGAAKPGARLCAPTGRQKFGYTLE